MSWPAPTRGGSRVEVCWAPTTPPSVPPATPPSTPPSTPSSSSSSGFSCSTLGWMIWLGLGWTMSCLTTTLVGLLFRLGGGGGGGGGVFAARNGTLTTGGVSSSTCQKDRTTPAVRRTTWRAIETV